MATDSAASDSASSLQHSTQHSKAKGNWTRSVNVVVAANKFSNTWEKVKLCDAYALDTKPHTHLGALFTVVVWLSTLAYGVVITYQYATADAVTTSTVEWSAGAGLFPMRLVCQAMDGCFLTNWFGDNSTEELAEAAAVVEPNQQGCIHLLYGEYYTLNVTYISSSLHGMFFMYNSSNTSPALPRGWGIELDSEVRCSNTARICIEGVASMRSAVGPGLSLLSYVRTDNYTRSDRARLRHEWFVTTVSYIGDPYGENPCMHQLSRSGFQGIVQVQLRLNPSWNHLVVEKPSSWLNLWGTYGGAYSLFLQLGALSVMVIVGCKYLYSFFHEWRQGPGESKVHPVETV